jgi:eukaryotic-like serine/threonine-protein kinase
MLVAMSQGMRTWADHVVGRALDGRYVVTEKIARGGMATVYLATDTRLEREVALKVMHAHLADDEEFVARFHREAKSAARLSNPHVVAVHDQGADVVSGTPVVYLAMEHVAGRTLRDLLDADAPLTPREALGVLDPVLDALGAAHHAGLVHRDVKPENVLLAADGRVKVADFGLARAASSSASGATTGMLIGTVAYLSPELVTRGIADARTDVYAAGILLFEMLTGRQPFTGEVPVQVAYQHVHEDVPPPSAVLAEDLPEDLDDLVLWATARDPDERPADARELLAEVREVRAALAADGDALDRRPAPVDAESPATGLPDTGETPHELRGRTLAMRRGGHGEPLALPVDETEGIGGTPPGRGDGDGAGAGDTGDLAAVAGWDPRRRRRRGLVGALAVVLLAVIAGVGAWYLTAGPGAFTTTPDLRGSTTTEARETLAGAGLSMRVDERYDDAVEEGRVVTTDPGPGADVRNGSTVVVAVSLGPEIRTMPSVVGVARDAATEALTGAGLRVGGVEEAYDQEVPEGQVVSQSVPPEEQVRAGTPVDLVVSLGREPVEVPDVTGQPREEAAAALEAAGLTLAVGEEVYDEAVPAGAVVRQDPGPGRALRGDAVTVVVSLGPPLVEVPLVRGEQLDVARTILEEAGFVVAVEEVLGAFFGTVRDQVPAAEEQAPRGSTVTLTVV